MEGCLPIRSLPMTRKKPSPTQGFKANLGKYRIVGRGAGIGFVSDLGFSLNAVGNGELWACLGADGP